MTKKKTYYNFGSIIVHKRKDKYYVKYVLNVVIKL